jgi:hypothetical protein
MQNGATKLKILAHGSGSFVAKTRSFSGKWLLTREYRV